MTRSLSLDAQKNLASVVRLKLVMLTFVHMKKCPLLYLEFWKGYDEHKSK